MITRERLGMIKLGSFYLDVEEMLLIEEQQSSSLEPKVLAVLLYFIDNNDRYISMAELHENLWQGRVVSDAAVRRIISKLRLLFDDDHKSPKYLKSLSKRGYKLICPLEYNAKNIGFEQLAFKNNALINTATTGLTLSNADSRLILLAILVVTLILLVTLYFIKNDANAVKNITTTKADYSKTTNNTLSKAQVIPTSAGIKLGLA